MIVSEDIYLEHFGVKGQKWGVRRRSNGGDQSSNKTESVSKSNKKRNLKIVGGVAVAAGAVFAARHMALKGKTPMRKAAKTMTDPNPNHRQQAAAIRQLMDRMNVEIGKDFRRNAQEMDARFITEPSAYRWTQVSDRYSARRYE